MAKVEDVDFKPKPIDEHFLENDKDYPVTGQHNNHDVRAEGMQRMDAAGKPYPTKWGIHGSHVAVDWETCIADGICMDVCPVSLFEWALNPGKSGTGNDHKIAKGTDEWNKYRTDKCDPVRESDCIFCMACESSCPVKAIKITP